LAFSRVPEAATSPEVIVTYKQTFPDLVFAQVPSAIPDSKGRYELLELELNEPELSCDYGIGLHLCKVDLNLLAVVVCSEAYATVEIPDAVLRLLLQACVNVLVE
jgi:hypothetical protein